MNPLRILVADDEAPARNWLRALITAESDCEFVAECASGAETLRACREHAPDALFLDVRMPELDGFEVLSALASPPSIVFVSAHDEHAVRAFEVDAVDYLLKPFDQRRLRVALDRIRRARSTPAPPPSEDDRLVAAAGGRVALLRFGEVDWIEAAGNYLHIHAAGRMHLARGTLGELLARAARHGFLRVHRSRIVRAAAVAGIAPAGSGDLDLELCDGTHLRASRRYRAAVAEHLRGASRPGHDAARPDPGRSARPIE